MQVSRLKLSSMEESQPIPCPTCKQNMHPYRKACHECERSYSRKELSMAMYETWIATHTKAESFDGIARIVLAKLNGREPE